jgi:hypothetical protein
LKIPDTTNLIYLAEYLNVSTDYLLNRAKTAPNNDILLEKVCVRYGLSEDALKNLRDITARTAPNELPGFIETTSGNISASAVLSAINAILTNELGLEMLQAFYRALQEKSTTNAIETIGGDGNDRNAKKQKEYDELLQFKAWKTFNRAIDSISRPKEEV